MKNKEFYADKLMDLALHKYDIAIDKKTHSPCECPADCEACLLCGNPEKYDCCEESYSLYEWAEEEYKEIYQLSHLEYYLLKYFLENKYHYITRNKELKLYVHSAPPRNVRGFWGINNGFAFFAIGEIFDNLFSFVKWEDEEPLSIRYILNNCVIKEENENNEE